MKKHATNLCFLFIALFVSNCSFAQTFYDGDLYLKVGGAFPNGDFGDDDEMDDDSGLAAPGISVGAEYIYPLNEKINFFGSVNINVNALDGDFRDDYEDLNDGVDVTWMKYISVPVSAGLQYSYEMNQKTALFFKVGATMNFLKLTDNIIEDDYSNYEKTQSFSLSSKLGYCAGFGFDIQDKYKIELCYTNAKEHEIEYEAKIKYSNGNFEKSENDYELDFSMIMLTIGIRLDLSK